MKTMEREITGLLARYGIKPNVATNGTGHLHFSWVAGTLPQSISTAKTPSDWRAHKNELARVKRMLKAAGCVPITNIKKATKPLIHLNGGRDLAESLIAIEARLAKMEADMELVMEIVTRPDNAIPGPAPAPVVESVQSEPKTRGGKRANSGRKVDHATYWLWRILRYDEYLPLPKIAEACGRTYTATASTLSYWKEQELVQHIARKGWRKSYKIEELINQAQKARI